LTANSKEDSLWSQARAAEMAVRAAREWTFCRTHEPAGMLETEPVNLNEAPSGGFYWGAASFWLGRLIHGALGSCGGAGGWRMNRSGWA